MRILFVIPVMACGGAEILMGDMAMELIAGGNTVKVVCLHPHHPSFKNFPNREVFLQATSTQVLKSHIRFSMLSGLLPETCFELQGIYNEFKPDIIHSHLFQAEIVSRSVIYPAAKWFSHCHDNMRQFEPFHFSTLMDKRKLTEYYERSYLFSRYRKNGGTHFIAISKDAQSYFQRVLPTGLRHITWLPNAINTRRFNKPEGYIKTKTADVVLTTSGSLVDKKNQVFLIPVVKALKQKGMEVILNILGDGPNRNMLKHAIEANGLNDNIILYGSVGNVADFLWNSDIYVHAALYEPFGLVLVEAMAAGLPVVSLDGKGNRDIIEDGRNGFLLTRQDVVDFTGKIMQLIDDKNLYRQMSNNALNTSAKYNIADYVTKLITLYKG